MKKENDVQNLTQEIILKFKDPLSYGKARAEQRKRYKHFQLEELKLLSVCASEEDRVKYASLASRMKKYMLFTDVLADPDNMELYVYGRLFFLSRFLKKDGLRYQRPLRCWLYQVNAGR